MPTHATNKTSETIGAEIVDEGGLGLDVRFVHAELFGDDLLDALFDVLHCGLPFPSRIYVCSRDIG